MNYKLTIYGNNMYKEFVLDESKDILTMGTLNRCHICFQKERFQTDFEIRVTREEKDKFIISCSQTVYFRKNNELKDYVRQLRVGDRLVICYHDTEKEFFYINFDYDFALVGNDYNLAIDWQRYDNVTVGGSGDCRIRIDDASLEKDKVFIRSVDGGYQVSATHTQFGISVNGFATREPVVFLHDGEFFSLKGYNFNIRSNILYTTKNAVVFTDLPISKIDAQKNYLKYPKFKRNVRQQYKLPEETKEILKPKAKDDSEEQNFLLTFLPVLVNLLLMVVLRGVMGGGGMFALYFAATMTVSSTMSVISFVRERKKRKEKEEKREEVYLKYITVQEEGLKELRKKEKTIANQMHPRLDEYVTFIDDFDSRLFEKEKEHEDYLSVRIGDGVVPSCCQVTYKEEDYVETEDELVEYPKLMHEKYQYLENMPVLLNLRDTNAVGFIGARTKLYQMEKNLIIEYAASHFYKDVKLFLIMDEDDVPLFEWARWIQNTYNDMTGTRNFMYDEASAKISLEFLYSELSRRESLASVAGLEDYIVFVYKSDIISDHPVSEYVSKAKELGFHFIFFEEHEELLHSECTKRIFLNAREFSGYIQDVKDGQAIQEFRYSHISREQAEAAAKRLAGVYVDEVSLENQLTKNITLFELLDIMNPYDLELEKRWAESRIFESMAAPLGVKSGDEIVYLDLHEKYHGPHGLVAGTTGSGKSEIMQTYILSMATLFHPYEVGFIIIDFKGGGMVNQFLNLPHLNGAITNIDGKEIDRSLMSIKAELLKRQELFAEQNVNHINDYIRAYKEGKATTPLPHLILIVDEFAELKSDQPEFMKELISTARIGRSLGVHLILATQKPSGVVNDQIWSNSKFKLCLKVQNKNDSNEVLKSPLAAEIREPGRAYLQVGNNEIFQLFQSAFSGAPAKNDGINNQKKFRITSVELSGMRKVIYEQAPKNDAGGETQLDALVNYIHEYCEEHHIQKLPNICLPPLATNIPYTLEGFENATNDISIPIGLVDDPSRQRQYVESLNFSQSNIFILGSSLSGKTCMLQSILYGITQLYSPVDVNIYIMDFASMILKNFEAMNHVGGVIINGEDDKLKNFLKMIKEMIANRKEFLSKKGLSSFSSYRESGEKELPQIIILLDNWISFKNNYGDYSEVLMELVRDSVSVGISFVMTASQSGGIGFKLLASFNKRIALYCNDSGDYATLYEHNRVKPDSIPGRGIAEINRAFYECQYYISFAAEKEFERVNLIREYISDIKKKYNKLYAKGIPVVPEYVTEPFIIQEFGENLIGNYDAFLGMEYNSISPRRLLMSKMSFMNFIGGNKPLRIAYTNYLLNRIISRMDAYPAKLYICDDESGSLNSCASKAEFYTAKASEAGDMLNKVYESLNERKADIQMKGRDIHSLPFIYIVINSQDAINNIADNGGSTKMKEIVTAMKDLRVFILFSNVEDEQVSFSGSDIMKMIRDSKRFLCFHDLKDVKITDIPMAVNKEFRKPLTGKDAYLINGATVEKIHIIESVTKE